MSTFFSRLYTDAADLDRLIEFLPVARTANRVGDYPSATDLREMLCQPELQARTRLWFDQDDQLIAFALVDAFRNLLFDYLPPANSPELEDAIMQWGMMCGELPLDAVCREDDVERVAWLTRHGFQPQDVRTLRFIRAVSDPISDPQLPADFIIRSVAGESEIEALVALHRAAFGTDHMTIEERRAMMSGPDYDPTLDLVAVAPDGRLAGFCVCGISVEENAVTGRNEGYTDPIGVHADFQKKGLARALLLTGLRLLRERAVDYAVLGTSSENAAMQAVAQSVGFRVECSKVWFSKQV
jgi:ribosomal protein S18 acetylase RimI-like enzyme